MSKTKTPPQLPKHLAVIMDGNGRWGRKRFLPRIVGHQKGVDSLRALVKDCREFGIPVLTVFAFSSENWNRPPEEVNFLMELFLKTLSSELKSLNEQGIQFRIIGDKTGLSSHLIDSIEKAESLTKKNTNLIFNVALNYGGKWDILQAMQAVVQSLISQNPAPVMSLDQLNQALSQRLALHDLPAPDLLIRTGGEQRISNFLLWDLAYTELFFTDVLWPDFRTENFQKALDFFAQRDRRFGTLKSDKSEN
ncbi:MAG: polyprenyl diphosphate synthase [Gammaproteobacteria bacterium]